MNRTELHELILSTIDLLLMAKQMDRAELENIFNTILDTSDGEYRARAEELQDILQNYVSKS